MSDGGGDGSQIMAGKTLKRRNFKQLSLNPGGGGSDKPNVQVSSSSASSDEKRPSSQAQGEEKLTNQLASLELGVEFKLDLRKDDFETLSELGCGNGGTVTRVLHVPTQTVMAKKVIHVEAKPAVRKQIVRELHIMHDCECPHIVGYYGAFANESDVIMCMEYMDCGSLDRIIKKFGPIEEAIIGKITVAIVEGLTYLYNQHRIIHRDVKPSNVLVNSRGQIKLCDFGVSGELINSIADTFVGTSTYMSPERIQGAAYSVRSDVWSLGITILELTIGTFPFSATSNSNNNNPALPVGILDLLQRIVNEPPPKLPEDKNFTAAFREFIDKCLAKEELRPSPQNLLNDPFFLASKETQISLEQWAHSLKFPDKK
ncbi:hypothetical protein TRICI_004556 [Trichomonascus ciferrii]|uniref:mitogen-activated protein kinase kinase n=1 Tax=Trichomonascus ciferrii TaxID=44093 RepID=A0A642V0G9_9ASCO|nr:hypothetical protein TRICI_004556 [Trichomonascus ciferrii]